MSIICIGDTHIKYKEPYRTASFKFFEWLVKNYKNETIVHVGDIFDSSSPHNSLRLEIAKYLKEFKQVYLLQGNHDISKRQGCAIQYLSAFENIHIIENIEEIEIENKKCLFLPYKDSCKEEYEALTGKYDFIFTHVMPDKCQFQDEGLSLNLKGCYIWGHHHIRESYSDKNSNINEIIGVPIPTRHLEQNQEHRIIKIVDDGGRENISVPQTFTYRDIDFGIEIQDEYKNDILNIINAPSYPAALEMYKDYYIRRAGITIKRTAMENDSENDIDNKNLSIDEKFVIYSKKESLSKEIVECCLQNLSNIVRENL